MANFYFFYFYLNEYINVYSTNMTAYKPEYLVVSNNFSLIHLIYSVVFDASVVNVIAVGEHAVAAIVPGRTKSFLTLLFSFIASKFIMKGHIKISRLMALLRIKNEYSITIHNSLQRQGQRLQLVLI